ncbi:uncharacterized protein M6B38_320165 [Iris pallida]|uniref:Transposase-associated domain-containing protein n=1 Tax=Iris pallida TaxID=29817 RepID=A0AAX6HC38_IRIPA|nr:uncharacterized protein M6B38_320165 [Iris pallida]
MRLSFSSSIELIITYKKTMSHYLVDRTWMYKRQHESKIGLNDEFKAGVEEFLKYASSQPDFMDGSLIKCPCVKCHNIPYKEVDLVRKHLYLKGFVQNYKQWTAQGEPLFPQYQPSFDMEVGEGVHGDHFEHRQQNQTHEIATGSSFNSEDTNPDLWVQAVGRENTDNVVYGTGSLASQPSVNSKAPPPGYSPPGHSDTDPPPPLTLEHMTTMIFDLQRQLREFTETLPAPARAALSAYPAVPHVAAPAPPVPHAPHVAAPAPPVPHAPSPAALVLPEAMQQMMTSFLADFMRRQQYPPPPPPPTE